MNKTINEFPEGSAEFYVAWKTAINKKYLHLDHNMFTMRIEKEMLFFDLEEDLARELCSMDLTEDVVDKVSYLDIVASMHNEDSYNMVRTLSMKMRAIEYDKTEAEHQMCLLCTIANSYFTAMFGNLTTVESIKRQIPSPVYLNILSKTRDIEVLYTDSDGIEYAGILSQVGIQRNMFGVPYVSGNIEIISRGLNNTFVKNVVDFKSDYKAMMCKIEDTGLTVMTPEIKDRFTKRGEKYVEITGDPLYCHYKGFAWCPGRFGDVRINVSGRVMVDSSAMRIMNPGLGDGWYTGYPFNSHGTTGKPAEKSYWMMSPVVFGFSFQNKAWARFRIEDLYPTTFSTQSLDDLVIPEGYKDIFIAALQNDIPSLDAIEGKGGGQIFLLFGPAGSGKTMTAESVAEYLKMPLYFVSVGELGTRPDQVEERLEKVMNVAVRWNAIVLLDEVDVFAAKRDNTNIERTAMVAIFLRLLERYAGIMFMTTNLVGNLDRAFMSRTTPIEYKALEDTERVTIWKNLLSKASKVVEIDPGVDENIATLATHKLNGREIKNNLRLACSLAKSKEEQKLTFDIITSVISTTAVKTVMEAENYSTTAHK